MKTLIKVKFVPVKGKSKFVEHIFYEEFDIDEADQEFEMQCQNIIEEIRESFPYYIIENWFIVEHMIMSDCDFGAMNAIKMMNAIQKKKYKFNKRDKSLDGIENSWLSPEGKIYHVKGYHVEVAHDLTDDLIEKDIYRYKSRCQILESEGWLRFQNWNYRAVDKSVNKISQHIYGESVSKEQMKILVKFARKNNFSLRDVLDVINYSCDLHDKKTLKLCRENYGKFDLKIEE